VRDEACPLSTRGGGPVDLRGERVPERRQVRLRDESARPRGASGTRLRAGVRGRRGADAGRGGLRAPARELRSDLKYGRISLDTISGASGRMNLQRPAPLRHSPRGGTAAQRRPWYSRFHSVPESRQAWDTPVEERQRRAQAEREPVAAAHEITTQASRFPPRSHPAAEMAATKMTSHVQ